MRSLSVTLILSSRDDLSRSACPARSSSSSSVSKRTFLRVLEQVFLVPRPSRSSSSRSLRIVSSSRTSDISRPTRAVWNSERFSPPVLVFLQSAVVLSEFREFHGEFAAVFFQSLYIFLGFHTVLRQCFRTPLIPLGLQGLQGIFRLFLFPLVPFHRAVALPPGSTCALRSSRGLLGASCFRGRFPARRRLASSAFSPHLLSWSMFFAVVDLVQRTSYWPPWSWIFSCSPWEPLSAEPASLSSKWTDTSPH